MIKNKSNKGFPHSVSNFRRTGCIMSYPSKNFMPKVMLILPKVVLIKAADKAKAKSSPKGFNS